MLLFFFDIVFDVGLIINKVPLIEHSLSVPSYWYHSNRFEKGRDRDGKLSAQTEKTHQMMMFMDSIAKERSAMSEKMIESSVRETLTMKTRVGEGSSSKDNRRKMREGKSENEDGNTERNKF